jgi:chromosome segregation ATPase
MNDALKTRLIWILAVVAAIFFVSTIGSCSALSKIRGKKDSEMSKRLDAEEKLEKCTSDLAKLKSGSDRSSKELEETKKALAEARSALTQEQMISDSLKEEIGKVNRLKDALEENLKEALSDRSAAGKTKK